MNLQGQASLLRGRARRARRESGYAMAALLTMLAVMSILLSAALPVWRHQMQREREAELVFRGEQYARAVGLFNQKHRTFPPNLDVLVQQKFLRKKYKDPITGKDFRPIYAGGLPTRQGQARPGVPQSADQTPDPRASSALQPAQGSGPTAGVMGVTSESDQTSIRVYKGRTKYNQWQFVYAQASGRPGGPGAQPMPGRPGGRRGRPGEPGSEGGPPRMRPGGPPFGPPTSTPRPPSGQRPPGGGN